MTSQVRLHAVGLGLLIYLSLSLGGVGLANPSIHQSLAWLLLTIAAAVCALRSPWHHTLAGLVPFFLISLLLLAQYSRTEIFQNTAALAKIDGTILATPVCFALLAYGVRHHGRNLVDGFILASFIILISTIVYKVHFGLTDRSVRFFLNGPIIFGWLMGLAAIFSYQRYALGHGRLYLIWFVVFASAVAWSASKGPLVATTFTVLVISVFYLKIGRFSIAALLTTTAYFVASHLDLIPSRLSAIERLLNNRVESKDAGSVLERVYMWKKSLQIFLDNPIFGVGLGNWSAWSGMPYHYPHNIFLEILTEHGLFGLGIFLAAVGLLLKASSDLSRLTLIFFGVCLTFSGDAGYWHFLIALPAALARLKESSSSQSRKSGGPPFAVGPVT